MSNIKAHAVNVLNSRFNNPETITRAQILECVESGAFKWPYWITDWKHGYVVSRGVFRMPTLEDAAKKVEKIPAPTPMSFVVSTPKGETLPIAGTFMTAAEALESFITARKRAKKGYGFATLETVSPAPVS